MELEVEVWEAEGKASCLASISYTTACGRRESHAGVLPCTYTKLVDLVGLDWLFSSGPSSLEEDLDPQVEWWLGHRFLGVKSKNDPIVGTPIVWPLTKLSRMCTNLLQLIAEVWAWTRLSPCWRSQEASLSWICFLPAQMLRMRWHVRVCVTAAGAENFRKLFQVCFIWKGRPCVLAPQSFGYLQVRKKTHLLFIIANAKKFALNLTKLSGWLVRHDHGTLAPNVASSNTVRAQLVWTSSGLRSKWLLWRRNLRQKLGHREMI